MYNELLIKALRWCADESICCDDFSGEKCPYFDEKKGSCSADEILHAAADEIEAADKRIAELSLDNKMLKNTIDDDKGVMLDRIRFLEAQLPKEGEWVMDCLAPQMDEYRIGKWKYAPKCSECGTHWDAKTDYCPNCGARMKTVTDCHTLKEGER